MQYVISDSLLKGMLSQQEYLPIAICSSELMQVILIWNLNTVNCVSDVSIYPAARITKKDASSFSAMLAVYKFFSNMDSLAERQGVSTLRPCESRALSFKQRMLQTLKGNHVPSHLQNPEEFM